MTKREEKDRNEKISDLWQAWGVQPSLARGKMGWIENPKTREIHLN